MRQEYAVTLSRSELRSPSLQAFMAKFGDATTGGSVAYGLLQRRKMKHQWFASPLVVVVVFVARTLPAAEPPSVSTTESTAQRREWYGWQTALADVAALALGATVIGISGNRSGGSDVGSVVGVLTVSSFALGAPAVHAAHGQWEKAGASLGLRLGAPAAGALGGFLVGSASCPHDESDVPCSAIGGGLGLFIGAATAIIVDSAVIAYGPEPEAALGLRVTPIIIADRDRWGAGFGGAF